MDEFTFGAPQEETKEIEQLLEIEIKQPEIQLTEAQVEAIDKLKDQIDINNVMGVMTYGAKEQSRLSEFSDQALDKVKSHELGDVGKIINELVIELESFDPDENDGFLTKLFKRGKNKIETMMIRFEDVNANVSRILNNLEGHYLTITNDILTLEEMSEANKLFYQNLSVYVAAGQAKIIELKGTTLPELQNKAAGQNQEDLNNLSEFSDKLTQFEKKVHDLDMTKMISQQLATQIRVIQNANKAMAYKIQSTMTNTIPMWKQQMTIALSAQHTLSAIEADNAVSDITNELFKKNAEKIHHVSTQAAESSEKSIVDIETLNEVNTQTIAALKDIQVIREKGAANRKHAQEEMLRMRTELANALIDVTK
ncbi:toxic anion resistance protein [Enterococcus sp. LJL51]|uniref:toxic anion resistance protein n=1 Tax=Enterococcus sp. LJL51 TaxID=3416656 RepID=UPI003CE978D3